MNTERTGAFTDEQLVLMRAVLTDGTKLLIDTIHDDANWPKVSLDVVAPPGVGDIGKWGTVLNYRKHVGTLLVLLARARAGLDSEPAPAPVPTPPVVLVPAVESPAVPVVEVPPAPAPSVPVVASPPPLVEVPPAPVQPPAPVAEGSATPVLGPTTLEYLPGGIVIERLPDGHINNCAVRRGRPTVECLVCRGTCPGSKRAL